MHMLRTNCISIYISHLHNVSDHRTHTDMDQCMGWVRGIETLFYNYWI